MTHPDDRKSMRGRRIKELRKITHLSRRAFADKHEIPAGTLQNWEDAKFGGLTEKGAQRLIEVFAREGILCHLAWLMHGEGEKPITQRLMAHHVIAIEKDQAYANDEAIIQQELQTFYRLNPTAIHTIIHDDLMEPYFFRGDIVAGKRRFHEEINQLVGKDCIMQTQAGEIVVRRLHSGNHQQDYLLKSHQDDVNANKKYLDPIKLICAAPVSWIRRMI